MVDASPVFTPAKVLRPVTPLSILTEHLQLALQQVEHNGNTNPAVHHHLRQAFQLASGLDPYIEACSSEESPALKTIAIRTQQESWNHLFSDGQTVRPLESEMLSGHLEGQVLQMFVYMTRAQRILDIGMFTGYSALAMAEALPEQGKLIACEVDAYVARVAQTLFQVSPHGDKIQVEVGSALETLDRLIADQAVFDLVFIDADKQEYIEYFHRLLDGNLLAPEGFICVDNTLLQGQPYLPPEDRSPNGAAIAQFNQIVADDPRVKQVLLPLRDGLTIIRRIT